MDLEKLVQGIKQYVDAQNAKHKQALHDQVQELQEANKALREELEGRLGEHTAEVHKRLTEAPVPADGRDGLDIEVLSCINTEKAYPRGTYARHNGGLWKSFQTTEGTRGWECIVEGVISLDVSQVGRDITVTQSLSSGATQEKSFSVPMLLYKGTYETAGTYAQGDVVTHSGSTWVALKSTSSIPGSGQDWQLAVKKGRDGKSVSVDDVLSKMLPEDQ